MNWVRCIRPSSRRRRPLRWGLALCVLLFAALATPRPAVADDDAPPPPPPPSTWDDDAPPPRQAPRQTPRPAPGELPPPRVVVPETGAVIPQQPPPPTPRAVAPRVVPVPGTATPGPQPALPAPDERRALQPPPAGSGPIIERIEFDGTVVYSPQSIKVLLRNKEGAPLDEVALDEDIKTLFQYFKEVDIKQVDGTRGGVVLRISVSENPLIVQLNIRGAAEIEESEIRGVMRTRVGFPLNIYHLSEDAETIVAMYRLRGFHFAHVPEPLITTLPNGGRRVDLSVVEGPQVAVACIIIQGNYSVSTKDIKEVMLTKEPDFFQSIFGGATFREEVLTEDIVAIKELYRLEGFLDVEVVLDDLRFSDDKQKAIVSIAVTEHQPYITGEIEVEIERLEDVASICATAEDVRYFTEERLRSWIQLAPGSRYSGRTLREGLEKIQEEYFRRSFLEAEVDIDQQQGRERELVVDVKIKVVEGPKLRLARIDFVGNEFTRDRILRREVHLSPGGYVDRSELERGEARMRRTGYFDRVSMRMDDAIGPDGEELQGYKSVTYEFVEGRTGSFNFGLGLSTDGGFFGSITYTKRNFDIARWPRSWSEWGSRRAFTGAGQEFRVFLQPSTVESAFSVNFREPRLFGSLFSFDVGVYKSLAFREDYDVDRTGYGIGLGYPLLRARDDTRRLNLGLRWRHEWVDISDLGTRAVPGAYLFRGTNEIRSLSLSARYRAIDDIRDPIWEASLSGTAELAGLGLGGDIDLYKLLLSADYTRVLTEDDEGKKTRLNTSLRVQFGEALDDTPEMPPYERFYAGGTSFRGFRFRGMGPQINGHPTGGEWYVGGTFEYEYPIIADTLGLVAFTDWGTLATTYWDDNAHLWRLTAGFGLRIVIPAMGDRPLAFDFGFPIFFEDDDDRQVLSFSLGRDF